MHFALQQGDGGGRGALGTHLGFHIPGEGEVVRVGQAVGDHRRFQRHNGQAQVERLQQAGGEDKRGGQGRVHQVLI
ncbi:MAG TPA: hypothetical protein PLE10_05805 [Brevefilum sp.]|nr:hypothetical protein [Brevefilum sp.]